jgi:hypothetical protein
MADSKYEEERRDEAALRELLRRDFSAQSAVRIVDRPVVEKKVDVKSPDRASDRRDRSDRRT